MLQRAIARTIVRAFSTRKETPLRFLVVDGYTVEGRADLRAGGASEAGWLYRDMLKRSSPVGAESDIVYPADTGFRFPDIKGYDGVAWTGCSLCIYSEEERVLRQIEFARHMYELGIPMFGSCWSIQIAAVAAGGKCGLNPKGREMGIARKIHLTPEGRSHPMYEGKPAVFDAFISHNDEVTHPPPVSAVLAGNSWTQIQGLSVTHKKGQFWAVQYHPEYDLHELARLTNCRKKVLTSKGFFKSEADADAYIEDLEALHKDPKRFDLAWKYAIDTDVLAEDVRCVEVRNWIRKQVMPYRHLRLGTA
jgi:GMP synthase (glutamine-hydrolysing)